MNCVRKCFSCFLCRRSDFRAAMIFLNIACSVLLSFRPVRVTDAAEDLAGLSEMVILKKDSFKVPVAETLENAAAKLREAIKPLDRLLVQSPSGADWKTYLNWPELLKQASDPTGADLKTVQMLEGLFLADENGLEMPKFSHVGRVLSKYARLLESSKNPKSSEVLASRLDQLSRALSVGATSGASADLETVGPILRDLEDSGQAEDVVARVRKVLGQPNLFVEVDEALLSHSVNRDVDQTAPVREVVLGTQISGTGHTTGRVTLNLVPSTAAAMFDITLDATNHSNTVGHNGPVTVRTTGTTKLDARKRLTVNDQRVNSMPVEATASTDTDITGVSVSAKFGKKIIRKIANRKIAQSTPQAEAIAEGRARTRLKKEFELQTEPTISKAAAEYQSKFRDPFLKKGAFPESLLLTTTDQSLRVVAMKAIDNQIAAASSPPAADPDAILSARVHETMINNTAEKMLGGRTITQEEVEKQIKESNVKLPESLANDADQPSWSITFARTKPIEIDATDNHIRLTIRGSRYTSGEREFDAMDIWVGYHIESADGKTKLVREGDVQIYPPGFKPGGDEKLTITQTSLRRILQRRFGKIFKEVVDVESLELPGEMKSAGPLPLQQLVVSKSGWISAGWRKRDAAVVSEKTISEKPPVLLVGNDFVTLP